MNQLPHDPRYPPQQGHDPRYPQQGHDPRYPQQGHDPRYPPPPPQGHDPRYPPPPGGPPPGWPPPGAPPPGWPPQGSLPPTSPPPPPSGRSWWSRNWKWALPVGCLLPLVLCGGAVVVFAFAIFGTVSTAVRNSDAYQVGMAQARANPQVVAALGEPIESGWMIQGSINVDGQSGNVDVQIPISGPKSSGTLYVVGTRSAGRWQYSTMAVEVPGSAGRIDVRPRAP